MRQKRLKITSFVDDSKESIARLKLTRAFYDFEIKPLRLNIC